MTETEWAAATDPLAMLIFLRRIAASDRKHRLFACACCRLIWNTFPDQRNRDLVIAVEDHPNCCFEDPEIHGPAVASSACESECRGVPAYWVAKYLGRGFYKMSAAASAAVVSAKVLFLHDQESGREVEDSLFRPMLSSEPSTESVRLPGALPPALRASANVQAMLLRDIFGNAVRPPRFDPTWRSEPVVLMARGMYESRDYGAMPILADALQEAGCDDHDVLRHCRTERLHVRGCWVVDLILGKP